MRNSLLYGNLLWIPALALMVSCSAPTERTVPVVSFEEIEPLFGKKNDTVYVINFWATWCKPCIKELPAFEELNENFRNRKVELVLISLDFPNKHESHLLPFIEEHDIRSRVIHLADTDANKWIDKVSPLWSGSIPATLIYKGNSKEFYEKTLTYEELEKIVESKIAEK